MQIFISQNGAKRAVMEALEAGQVRETDQALIKRSKGISADRSGFQGWVVRIQRNDRAFWL